MLVRLAIDFENPTRAWWENGGQELWESRVCQIHSKAVGRCLRCDEETRA